MISTRKLNRWPSRCIADRGTSYSTGKAPMTEPRDPSGPADRGAPDPNDVPPPPPPTPPAPPPEARTAGRPVEPVAPRDGLPPAVTTPVAPPNPWHKRWTTRLLAALIVVPLLIFAIWAAVALNVVYERGERYGYVQNFAEKGIVCATWEGELAMTNVPGVPPEVFPFSVRDDAVAADIQASIGKRVALSYEEHRNVPTSCFAKTDHFVTGVRVEEP